MDIFKISSRFSLGISFALNGLPLVWVFRSIIGESSAQIYSNLFMILSLVLMTNFQRINVVINKFGSLSTAPLFFLLPAFIASIFVSDNDLSSISLYLLFSIVFCVLINTIKKSQLDSFPVVSMILTGGTSIISLLYSFITSREFTGQRLVVGEINSPGPLAFVGAYAIITAFFLIFHLRIKLFALIVVFISVMSGSFIVLTASIRSVLISISLCFIYSLLNILSTKKYAIQKKIEQRKNINAILYIFVFLCILLIIFYSLSSITAFDELNTTISRYTENLITNSLNGFNSYFYGTSEEASAAGRRDSLDIAINGLDIYGHGFMSFWVDCPLIQAFYDGGVIGGVLFGTITLLCPLFLIFRNFNFAEEDMIKQIVLYYYIFTIPWLFLHGHPYNFYLWLRIILFYRVIDFK
jgi:hypothetical protein